ncbi:MAG: hypothetical protein ABSF44_06470 [Candidatus Bathyarchaeia archaeon]
MEPKIIDCPHCGKIIPEYVLKGGSMRTTVTCPDCGSRRNYKNGMRYTRSGQIQTYVCRHCYRRFS